MLTEFQLPCPVVSISTSSSEWWDLLPPTTARRIFLCTISGGSVTLPISSFQYNLYRDGTAYLSVVVPAADAYAGDILSAIGGVLAIEQGYEYADGSRQTTEMVSAPLTSVRTDAGPRSQSATLIARGGMEFTVDSTVTKEITGVSYIATYSDGKNTVRSSPVFGLFPGDVILIDGRSCLVDSLTVYADQKVQNMEITYEAAAVNTLYELTENTNTGLTGF